MQIRTVYRGPNLKRHGSANAWLVAILLILTVLLFFKMMDGLPGSLLNPDAQSRPVTARGDLAQDEQSTIALFKSASGSVVHINTAGLRRDRVSLNVMEIPQGSGSGFVWDHDGHVVTNYHVIQGAEVARVILENDDNPYTARLVGAAPDKDLAVLKIDVPKSKLSPIPIGKSSDLQVGQKVFAIGNPFSLDQTLTTGVISGLGREITSVTQRPIQDVIQTDAAINPGNSGGPLLDSAGLLIGVNTAIYSPSGAYAGIGFAVPVDTVNAIVPQLIRSGKIDRPGLGVALWSDTHVQRLMERNSLPRAGALVREVSKGSAAEKAGIRPTQERDGRILIGDLIIAIDGTPINEQKDLFRILEGRQVGDNVSVTVQRADEQIDLQATLQALPSG